jgi:hypothetical protein
MLVMIGSSVALYTFLFLTGKQLLNHPRDQAALGVVAVLLQVMCGLGLFRAWELLGASRQGLLSWLNPLLDLDELPATEGDRDAEGPAQGTAATASAAQQPASGQG